MWAQRGELPVDAHSVRYSGKVVKLTTCAQRNERRICPNQSKKEIKRRINIFKERREYHGVVGRIGGKRQGCVVSGCGRLVGLMTNDALRRTRNTDVKADDC